MCCGHILHIVLFSTVWGLAAFWLIYAGLWHERVLYIGTQCALPGRRQTFAGIFPYPTWCCFVLFFSVHHVIRDDLFKSSATPATRKPTVLFSYPRDCDFARYSTRKRVLALAMHCDFVRSSTRQRILDVYCTWIRLILRCRPTTSGVSSCAPALMLGLSWKQDTCIDSP